MTDAAFALHQGDFRDFVCPEDAMVAAIERLGLLELPAEVEGNQTYVPVEVDLDDAEVERGFWRVPKPQEAM